MPWQIGEIACRIGQLYYQFYLRKGDTCYLDEAYVFYEAIRARQYLGISCPGVRVDPRVVLRRLRYYVRFCAVCLLMGRRGLLLQLLTELDSLVRLCCVRPLLRGPAAPLQPVEIAAATEGLHASPECDSDDRCEMPHKRRIAN